ncbi:conserved domain protein [Verrucomicrobiia bacterium DG1235]|nr:conserved domain protein [Verrucomicrobiae bacterium DG1235]
MTNETSLPISRADSYAPDATQAIGELDAALAFSKSALTVFFCDPSYDLDAMTAEINQRAQGSPVISCSSAGEIGSKGYQKQSVAGFSLSKDEFHVAVESFENIREFSADQASQIVEKAKANLQSQGLTLEDNKCFALLLVDGLSAAEEPLTYKLQDALKEIPLVGGSAGDGLNFGKTHTFCDGSFKSDVAALAIIHTNRPWEVFKEQHISPTDAKLVVTESDPDNRVIIEFNGEPAAEELARVIGTSGPEALSSGVLAEHPLMLKMGGTWFIRSAHSVIEDNCLKLFCAIEEGLVLSVGKTEDLPGSLDKTLSEIKSRIGDVKLTIACDCILRRLELEATEKVEEASCVLSKYNPVGFSTYGEQYGTVHVNQTLTGIVIG